jgi:hypothetical protein
MSLSAGGLTGVTPSARHRARLAAPALRLALAAQQRARRLALRAPLSVQGQARVTLSPALRLARSARQRADVASLALPMALSAQRQARAPLLRSPRFALRTRVQA